MITLTAPAPEPLSRTTAVRPAAPARRPRAAPVACRCRELAQVLRERHRPCRRRRRSGWCSCPRSPCCAIRPMSPAGPEPGRIGRGSGRRADVRTCRRAATANGIFVHASLYEKAPAADGLGFNTAILVSPAGELVGRTRKMHIPISAGYYEDTYFRAGPGGRRPVSGLRARWPRCPHRHADLLGRVVPGSRPQLLARRRRDRRLSDGDRFRADVPRLRYQTRSGSRSSSPTASTAASSWWCPTAPATKAA